MFLLQRAQSALMVQAVTLRQLNIPQWQILNVLRHFSMPFVGITASSDTFYPGQERYDTYSGKVYRDYQGLLKQWQDLNVMNYEMESATLFTMCNALGLRAGMVAGVIVNRTQQEIPNEATMKDTEDKAVSVVVEAARKLLA